MNCKQGDLAIVTHNTVPTGIGWIVRILHPADQRVATAFTVDSFIWKVLAPDGRECCHPDAWMRPVSGIPDEVECDEGIAA